MKDRDYTAALETPLPESVAADAEGEDGEEASERHWARMLCAAPTVRAGMDQLFDA